METIPYRALLAVVVAFLIAATTPASAQTIGYAEAIDRLAIACGKDINTHCRKVNLGGGRVMQCLTRNQASVSGNCKATIGQVRALLQARTEARATVRRVCDADIRRLCAGVREGDGYLLECFFKVRQRASTQCQAAVANAGWN